jgi:uncharacterized protein YegP (UPF0339 family)
MIHIVKAGKQNKEFMVVVIGYNGKVLSTSETLKSKASCYKNIRGLMKQLGGTAYINFQDDTKEVSVVYGISEAAVIIVKSGIPHKKYIPKSKK